MEVEDLGEQDQELVRLWNSSLSGSQVAERLGLSRHVVLGKVFRLRKRGVQLRKSARQKPMSSGVSVRPALTNRHKPVMVVTAPPPLESVGLHLFALKLESCRFIISTDRGIDNVVYCGATKSRGSYCAHHAHLCYNPPPRRLR